MRCAPPWPTTSVGSGAWCLRRMRARYRNRRDALVTTLTEMLPEAAVAGAAAGLRVTLQLPGTNNEQAIGKEAPDRGVEPETLSDYRPGPGNHRPTLLLDYGQIRETAIRDGVRELATAVDEARSRANRTGRS